ncbi:hypothetical protein [Nannocystis radixulma]|uniref:Uncharacterized protein n=1 Tax=Nannocystis radixulma TaxID=2995305 RepID=A0ABT5BCB4_9BACT|nr:hypothetical protein [Nannocystis radixulma]MDC0671761.1 hypothetical protein [Nannocystis radixulma]
MGAAVLNPRARPGALAVLAIGGCFYQPQVAATDATTTTSTSSTLDPPTGTTTTSTTSTATDALTGTTDPIGETTTTGTTTTSTDATSTTSTTGTDSSTTDDPAMCTIPDVPDLAVRITHDPAPATCENDIGIVLNAVFTGKPDEQTLLFRECTLHPDCEAGNVRCEATREISVRIDAPATHVPDFAPGACVNVAYLPAGYADPETCHIRLLRLAKTGPDIKSISVFVAAVGVPDTDELPGPLPLTLGFLAASELADACPHEMACDRPSGRHDLVADFPDALVTVPMGTESPAALDLLDKNNVKIGTLTGSLYNLRSYVLPVDQCEFDWLWLADENRP